MVPPPLSVSGSHILLVGVLGCWPTQPGWVRNSERLGFRTFVVLGKGKPAWRNLLWKSMAG